MSRWRDVSDAAPSCRRRDHESVMTRAPVTRIARARRWDALAGPMGRDHESVMTRAPVTRIARARRWDARATPVGRVRESRMTRARVRHASYASRRASRARRRDAPVRHVRCAHESRGTGARVPRTRPRVPSLRRARPPDARPSPRVLLAAPRRSVDRNHTARPSHQSLPHPPTEMTRDGRFPALGRQNANQPRLSL